MQRSRWVFLGAFVASIVGAGGCSAAHDPALDTASAKTGSLANGDFFFTCDDSVSCKDYRNYSTKFPDFIAEGAVFHVQYKVFSNSLTLSDNVPGQGYTLATVGSSYLTLGPEGFTGVKAGFGTIVVRTASGQTVDFTQINIATPDEIVVYDASYQGTAPDPVTTVTMNPTDTKQFRTLARQHQTNLAGVFETDWKSDHPEFVRVGTRVGGTISIEAVAGGTATLTVEGAALKQSVTVNVSGATK
jgi:hypothetical protein